MPSPTQSRATRPAPPPGAPRRRPALPGPDSLLWPGLVAAAFTLAQLAFVTPRMGLSWDETVYVSQVSGHAPAAFFDPARARGVPLLVAPVAAVTASVTALRCYLAVASGLALFVALLAWRGLRPAGLLALAGLTFAGLWTAQYYGPQAMPDLWVGLSALAAVGCFLRAARRLDTGLDRSARGPLAALTVALASAALFRPGDAIFLAAPLLLAALAVRAWRRWPLAAAVLAGLVAGGAEWVAEAYARFGGVLRRLHEAGAEQGGFRLSPGAWAELKALNGPTLCRPCAVAWRQPELGLWWLALPLIVALGLVAARAAGRLGSSALAAACALSVAVPYLFLVSYAAPRFLLPAYALLAIPVADALGWLVTGPRPGHRPLAAGLLACGLALQLVAQHLVLEHEVGGTVVYHDDYRRIAADLSRLGIRPPCLIRGEQFIPIAFVAGCASAGRPAVVAASGRVAVLEWPHAPRPSYARHWTRHRLAGTRVLHLVAYIS